MANMMRTDAVPNGGATSEVASSAKEGAVEVAATAGEEARAVARDAAAHARSVLDDTRGQLRTQATEQTDRLTATLRDVAEQLRAMVDGRGAPSGMVGDLASQLAGTANRAATRLDQGGFDAAVGDVKRFARNRPGAFLAFAAGAGFLAGRLLKAADTHALAEVVKPDSSSGTAPAVQVGGPSVHGSIGSGGTPLASDPFVVEP
jgi:ElaB/YqjD/DUF883 family membrane-anchored ribosome-binding protein